jgi:hypothetical protein
MHSPVFYLVHMLICYSRTRTATIKKAIGKTGEKLQLCPVVCKSNLRWHIESRVGCTKLTLWTSYACIYINTSNKSLSRPIERLDFHSIMKQTALVLARCWARESEFTVPKLRARIVQLVSIICTLLALACRQSQRGESTRASRALIFNVK